MPRISIIITNHNYGHFLRQAIDSALAMNYPDKEIIVSDDGSTDNSCNVIDSYGDRLVSVKKGHNGQCSAFNAALPRATGEIVFLLDSDDTYLPNAADAVVAAWRPGVSKVQFPLLMMDRNAARTGTMFPNFAEAFPPTYMRESLLSTGLCPTAPTTGNAYDIGMLRRIWPVPENGELAGIDSCLNVAAPLYGDVITLTKPLGCYRFHDSNMWAQSSFVPEKLAFYVEQDRRRTRYLCRLASAEGIKISETVLNKNTSHLTYRMGCRKALGTAAVHGSLLEIWYYGVAAVLRDRLSVRAKVLLLSWFTAVAVSPNPVASYLIKLRFIALSRSGRMNRFMRMMGVLKAPQVLPNS
jgi:glycosyltransferase involved in cell wall biosynthesis